MGWSIHVIPVTSFVAVCNDELACPGPRTTAEGGTVDGQWTGPERNTHEEAQRDADEHYRKHGELWHAMNEEWDRTS